MYTIKERIAIARIVSDMIKADNIIEESEIELLNRFKCEYNLDSHILSEAHRMKFSTAVSALSQMKGKEKIEIFQAIRNMAGADGLCVHKEAMLLLAMKYAFGIEMDKKTKQYKINHNRNVKLISCPTGEASISSQYVIYIEGKNYADVNQNIKQNFEVNVLSLRQWGFDFIYIPSLIEEFCTMNSEYVKDVINYMAPELSYETIDIVYDRLIKMDTVTFCNHVLADTLQVEDVKNTTPTLFINIGTSVVPYCQTSGPVECYTEFMCIPLENDVTVVIKEFIKAYSRLVSFHSTPSASYIGDTNCFKYFGFYKALFDFLVKAEPKESDIVIHPWNSSFEFPQIAVDDLVLSPQEAAIYKLIMECTYNRSLGGLPTIYDNKREIQEVEKIYKSIYHKDDASLPFNLAPIRSRIEKKMRQHLDSLVNIEDYIPKMKDSKYIISAHPSRIQIRNGHYDTPHAFLGYIWK